MKVLKIEGRRPLRGEIAVSGSKNAALPILFATVLARGVCELQRVPEITDVKIALQILKDLGASVEKEKDTYFICTDRVMPPSRPPCGTEQLRGSVYLLGAMLARFGMAEIGNFGGCDFGGRPIDYHLAAFRALGATVAEPKILARRLRGGDVYLPMPSVGATVNAILAAIGAAGETRIHGAAKEPHVIALAEFLIACGARIRGAGSKCILVEGGHPLRGARFSIPADMIEGGTFLALGCACGGPLGVMGCPWQELKAPMAVLRKMGASVRVENDCVWVERKIPLLGCTVQTSPYPGFPTDLQPQFGALLAMAKGGGWIYERVFPGRFRYTAQLNRMGGGVRVEGQRACFLGDAHLKGAVVCAEDLRAGAALTIAGLCAEGETHLLSYTTVERGYSDFLAKLSAIGAKVALTDSSALGLSVLGAEDSADAGEQRNTEIKEQKKGHGEGRSYP